MSLIRFLLVFLLLAGPLRALEDCDFSFEIDTQTSAFQALVDGAASRGGFWRPIREAPDDVQALGRFIGRLDVCLMTADGKPREIRTGNGTITLQSPHVTSCTAALLPGNRLLTNRHCYFEPRLVAAGFDRVREARINFGYVSKDFTGNVKTFLVDDRALDDDPATDALLLQIIGGDANDMLGGHVPMVMAEGATPRRALTMIHHPRGAPQQFSSGTCQVHPEQAALPGDVSQLRHSCESAGGSSGALLLDARSLAVVGLHNQGGLNARGGFNGGHKIGAVAAALGLGFTQTPGRGAPDPETDAMAALTEAFGKADTDARRAALEAVVAGFPGTRGAKAAQTALSLMAPPAPDPEVAASRALIEAMDIGDATRRAAALRRVQQRFAGTRAAGLAGRQLAALEAERQAPAPVAAPAPKKAAPKAETKDDAAEEVDDSPFAKLFGKTANRPSAKVAAKREAPPRIRAVAGMDLAFVTSGEGVPRGDKALRIDKVAEGSDAHAKGIRAGDFITEISQAKVSGPGDLESAMADARKNGRKSLLLLLRRDGAPRFVALSVQ